MISREQIGEALNFIANSDHKFAAAKTEVERASWLCKHARAIVYEMTKGDAKVDERKQEVERDSRVVAAEERRIAGILAFETLKAERESKQLLIEVFRTLEATRRRETVV